MDNQIDILAFGAHPDDVELSCAGTILKHVSLGNKIGIVDLTRGELGTRGSAQIRDQESAKAAKILGVEFRHNMNFEDCFFENNNKNKLEVVKVIRKYRPKIILCNAIDDRHPDHPKGSDLVSQACFLSGLSKIDTGQEKWRPKNVYHYIQFREIEPDFVVDISDFIDRKMESIKAYQSQFYNPNSQVPETIISSQSFLNSIEYRASNLGRLSGVKYGEGFTIEKPIVVDSLNSIF
ncbi:MAG: bacillithiol biosynthesis deacetylase BshB1 [Flavobacteriales bacterium]